MGFSCYEGTHICPPERTDNEAPLTAPLWPSMPRSARLKLPGVMQMSSMAINSPSPSIPAGRCCKKRTISSISIARKDAPYSRRMPRAARTKYASPSSK